jgi:hypothetical protein
MMLYILSVSGFLSHLKLVTFFRIKIINFCRFLINWYIFVNGINRTINSSDRSVIWLSYYIIYLLRNFTSGSI